MDIWFMGVESMTRDEIREAINDDAWQRFRRTLKGLSTESKLEQLWGYVSRRMDKGTYARVHQVRVDNYINALLRGGQLKHCEDGTIRVNR